MDIALLAKRAAEVSIKKRDSPQVHGLLNKLVFSQNELQDLTPKSLEQYQRIADYMTAAAPEQLLTAKVLSGPHKSSVLIKQIHRHKDHDTTLEDLFSTRDELAAAVAPITDTEIGQWDPLYFPHANTAVINTDSPGAMIHELGHAVDLMRRKDESNAKRYLRWLVKPLLWEELSAWSKGRDAYQRGAAADPKIRQEKLMNEYLKNMQSYNARKYPAYGTYLGGAAGAGLGLAGGIAAALAMARNTGAAPIGLLSLLGTTLGGGAGVFGGALAGRGWAALREGANREKAKRQLEALLAQGASQDVKSQLAKLQTKRKTKEPAPKRKAA